MSLLVSFILIPVVDSIVVERDRNRNMVYGELFWQEGLGVYEISDRDLNETYNVPEDHMLTGVLNVTYEYPVIALLFFACLAAIEPGVYGPNHWLANFVVLIIHHVNFTLFLYIGRKYLKENWFKQLVAVYFIMGIVSSVTFAKIDPLADLFLLSSIILLKQERNWIANTMLGLAVQTKFYPIMFFPFFITASPLASLAFFGCIFLTLVPFLSTGVFYDSLISHLLSSSQYATFIANPFYIGLVELNMLAIISPIILVIAFVYSVFEIESDSIIPLPTNNLRVKEWRNVLLFGLPLILIFFSWVLVWYYSWFIIPILFFENSEDISRYRIMFGAIWIAHIVGILINLEYFLEGPIAEFLAHLQL
ncbi:MAG: glycosyltransferase 87 family protein [Candidatus Thorarchaeota archaeon]